MTLESILEQSRSGSLLIVGELLQAPGLSASVRVITMTREQLASVPPMARASLLMSSKAYVIINRHCEESPQDGEAALFNEAGMTDGSPEIIKALVERMEVAVEEMKALWPLEWRNVNHLVHDLDTAKMCFHPDPLPGGFQNTPSLLPQGWGGQVLRLDFTPCGNGRVPQMLFSDGNIFMRLAHCPVPEGSFISVGDFNPPPNYG